MIALNMTAYPSVRKPAWGARTGRVGIRQRQAASCEAKRQTVRSVARRCTYAQGSRPRATASAGRVSSGPSDIWFSV